MRVSALSLPGYLFVVARVEIEVADREEQDYFHLHHGELLADAVAGAFFEGAEGVAGDGRGGGGGGGEGRGVEEAGGEKGVWGGEKVGAAVHGVLDYPDL
jgi:hypothetical protein